MAVTIKKVEKWAEKNKVKKVLKALTSKDYNVRTAAVKALGITKGEEAMNALISLLRDPDPTIRSNAIESLAEIGNDRALEFIKHLINNDSDEDVRKKAKKAFDTIKDTQNQAETEKTS